MAGLSSCLQAPAILREEWRAYGPLPRKKAPDPFGCTAIVHKASRIACDGCHTGAIAPDDNMGWMPPPQRSYRLIVQRATEGPLAGYRVIAYGGARSTARADFATLAALLDAIRLAVPNVTVNLNAKGSIIFAGEMPLSDAQLSALGLI